MRRFPARRRLIGRSLASSALAVLAGLAAPVNATAQSVSPPIAEYQQRARSSFQLINSGLFPLSVVLEVRGFSVTEQGEVQDVPLDTSRVHVKLSAMSFRIPPRGTYTVFYEATADSLPAWFNIVSAHERRPHRERAQRPGAPAPRRVPQPEAATQQGAGRRARVRARQRGREAARPAREPWPQSRPSAAGDRERGQDDQRAGGRVSAVPPHARAGPRWIGRARRRRTPDHPLRRFSMDTLLSAPTSP